LAWTHFFGLQVLSHNNWIPVDGGQLIGGIIRPAINGPVLSSIGLLFATLVATTIGNLYNRQTQLRSSFIRELEDLRRLGFLLESLPNPYRRQGQAELKSYCDYLLNAIKEGTFSAETYRQNELTVNGVFLLLNEIAKSAETNDSVVVPGAVLSEAYELVRRLGDHRTTRRALLESEFPPLHYFNLICLGSSICLIFLIETDGDLIFFLAGFQLRILWSMLIGTFAMIDEVVQVAQVPAGFYGNPSVLETQTVFLEKGEFYIFTIFDTSGEGLCCDYGEGKYQVSLGTNDISDTSAIIIESEGVFQYRTAHTFLASVHSDGLCKGPGSSCSFLGSCDDCCNEASCSFSGCKCL
jgi:hypothetical protein